MLGWSIWSVWLHCKQQTQQGGTSGLGVGIGNGDVVKRSMGAVSGERVMPPSRWCLSADWNRPRQRRKQTSSSLARGRSLSRGASGGMSNLSTMELRARTVDSLTAPATPMLIQIPTLYEKTPRIRIPTRLAQRTWVAYTSSNRLNLVSIARLRLHRSPGQISPLRICWHVRS